MVNSAAICKDSARGRIHAAIVFLDRNPGLLDRRLGGALGVMTMAFDAAWVITVALKDIAGEIAARVQSQRLPVRWRGSAPAPAASG